MTTKGAKKELIGNNESVPLFMSTSALDCAGSGLPEGHGDTLQQRHERRRRCPNFRKPQKEVLGKASWKIVDPGRPH